MKNIKLIISSLVILGTLLVIGLTSSHQQAKAATGITLEPTADAYIDSANPTSKYGTFSSLRVHGADQVGLVRFDTSNVKSDINKATLRLYKTNNNSMDRQMQIAETTKDWVENQVSWQKRDDTNDWVCTTCQDAVHDSKKKSTTLGVLKNTIGYQEWDVTNITKDWLAHPDKNFGFWISTDADCAPGGACGTTEVLSSRESLANRPQLVIETNDGTPIARAGDDQERDGGSVSPNGSVTLDGSESVDPAGLPLSYHWEITQKPDGSNPTFSNANISKPTLSFNVGGWYYAKLTVTNSLGKASSDSITVKNFYVQAAHPRLLITPDSVKNLIATKKGTPEWTNVINDADAYVLKGDNGWAYLPALGLAYNLIKETDPTRAQNYTTKAKNIMNGWFKQKGIKWAYPDILYAPEDLNGDNDPICYAWKCQLDAEDHCMYDAAGKVIMKCYDYKYYNNTSDGYAPGYNARAIWTLALGYDWFYDTLTAEEKALYIDRINKGLDKFYINGLWGEGAHLYGREASNWSHFLMETAMGIATYGDSDYAKFVINDARGTLYQAWKSTLNASANFGEPVLNFPVHSSKSTLTGGKGGYQIEGVGYAGMTVMNMLYASEMFRTATGENLIKDNPYSKDLIDYYSHFILPTTDVKTTNTTWFAYGNTNSSGWDGDNYRRSTIYLLYKEYRDGHLMNFLNSTPRGYFGFEKLLWYDSSAAKQPLSDLPLDDRVEGTNLISGRSDWGPATTWVAYQGGFHVAGHNQNDGGHFVIYKDGYLVAELVGLDGQSSFNNGLFIGGSGPMEGSNTPTAQLTEYENKQDSYIYAKSDIANGYNDVPIGWIGNTSQNKVDMAKRTFVYLKPNYVIVFDQIKTLGTNLSKEFRLHFKQEPTINGNAINMSNSKANLYQKALLPEGASITKSRCMATIAECKALHPTWTDTQCNDAIAACNSGSSGGYWRLKETPAGGTGQDSELFLNAFEVTDVGATSMVATNKIDSQEQTAVGVQIGDRVVMFGSWGQIQGSVTYTLNGTGTSKQMVTSLKKSVPYDILIDKVKTQSITSSDQGIINFDVTLGSTHEIQIVAQNAPAINIAKSADRTSAKSGDTITYTLNYSNTGSVAVTNAKIEDPIPVGTVFVSAENGGTLVGGKATWILGNLAAGANGTVKFTVKVN